MLDTHYINDDLIIFYGVMLLHSEQFESEITGVVYIDFVRKEIMIECSSNIRIPVTFDYPDSFNLSIPNFNMVSIEPIHLDQKRSQRDHLIARIINHEIAPKNQMADSVCLYLCNYLEGLPNVEYRVGDWHFKIQRRSDEKEIFKTLDSYSGTGNLLTHKIIIQRKSGELFDTSSTEFTNIVETIEWVASFTTARYVGCVLFEGLVNNATMWSSFVRPKRHNWKKVNNWFHPFGDMFIGVFDAVFAKITDEHWGNILKILLSWYIETYSESLVESTITSLQIAMETICWVYLIEVNDLIEETSFDKLNASDKLRLLLHEFKIDKGFSDNSFFNLEYIKKNFKDGPHLVTEIRNSIVHPSTKKKSKSKSEEYRNIDVLVYTWLLGTYYFELSMLGILNYQGRYSNRLETWRKILTVPWAIK